MSKICPHCATAVIDEANFCMKCGYSFEGIEQKSTENNTPANKRAAPWKQNTGVVNTKPVDGPVAGYETCNPTFHLRCEYCYFEFDYHAYDLGHRVWYPHGFVYCPRCHRPLRHKLEYEVTADQNEQEQPAPAADQSQRKPVFIF